MSHHDATTTALVDADWAQAHLDDPNVRFVEVDVDTTRLRAEPHPGRRRLELDEPAVRRHPPRHRVARGLQRAAVASRASAPTRRSSCTATTTTGSPPGPTGSSSCTAIDDVRILDGGRKYWLDNGPAADDRRAVLRRDRLPAARARLRAARLPRRHPAAPRRRRARARRRPLARPSSTARSSRPPGMTRDRPAGRPHPGRCVHPVGPDGQRGRHVQGRATSCARCTRPRASPPTRTSSPTAASASAPPHWFVLHELLGYERVRNYDGSWTEYGSLIGVPIEKPVAVAVGD